MTLLADTILIILPITNIVRLQLPKAQKVALLFVFSLGIFVMACTVVRCIALAPTVSAKDAMYYDASSNSWTFLEVDVSIICASLPVLRAPLNKLFPSIFRNMSTRAVSDRARVQYGGRFGELAGAISMQDQSDWRKSGQSRVRARHNVADDDTASDEERILRPSGILKTTEVRLTMLD